MIILVGMRTLTYTAITLLFKEWFGYVQIYNIISDLQCISINKIVCSINTFFKLLTLPIPIFNLKTIRLFLAWIWWCFYSCGRLGKFQTIIDCGFNMYLQTIAKIFKQFMTCITCKICNTLFTDCTFKGCTTIITHKNIQG